MNKLDFLKETLLFNETLQKLCTIVSIKLTEIIADPCNTKEYHK